MVETAFPHIKNALQQLNQRKPDILEIKMNGRECEIVEVTVCFDLYMDTSYQEKRNKYQPVINLLNRHGIATSISVMCFGSLGTVHKNVRGNLKRLGLSGEEGKETMKWCCVSNMICGSIIWRNRCPLSISLSLDYIKNIAKSNKLINSNVKNTKYKYYMRKIVDKIFTSHQNLYSIKSMSKNMYHKKPKFGIKTRHNLHGQFSAFRLFIFV